MKLVHINLNEAILVDAINCTEWVIESPEYFSEYVMELAGQVGGQLEGDFGGVHRVNININSLWWRCISFST